MVKKAPPAKSSPMLQRVQTGIPGFDKLIEGGLLQKSTYLVSGGVGSGKTIFSMQFLYNGATKYNEPGVFLSFEEPIIDIKRDVSRFGWDIDKLEQGNKLRILHEEPYNVDKFSNIIEGAIYEIGAKRLVIDSTSVFGLALQTEHDFRMKLFELSRLLEKMGVTTLLTSEVVENSNGLSRFGVEEFVVDGVVLLSYLGMGEEYSRSLVIKKMRATDHGQDVYPVEIDKDGIKVLKGATSNI
jgi:KaiC/GvpD/RAD55 family RecA-like ATPase